MAPRNSGSILPLHDRTLRDGRPSKPTPPSSKPKGLLSRRSLKHPRLSFIPNRVRNEALAFIAELSGTFMFLFLSFGPTQVANAAAARAGDATSTSGSLSQAPNANTLQYISLAFGFSLAINVWIFFRISGGLFNPVREHGFMPQAWLVIRDNLADSYLQVVSLSLYLVGAIKATRTVVCFVAQILGGIFAAAVVSLLHNSIVQQETNASIGRSTGYFPVP